MRIARSHIYRIFSLLFLSLYFLTSSSDRPTFRDIWLNHDDRGLMRYYEYASIYEEHMTRFFDKDKIVFLEIGLQSGGSMQVLVSSLSLLSSLMCHDS